MDLVFFIFVKGVDFFYIKQVDFAISRKGLYFMGFVGFEVLGLGVVLW